MSLPVAPEASPSPPLHVGLCRGHVGHVWLVWLVGYWGVNVGVNSIHSHLWGANVYVHTSGGGPDR